jgi:L-fucono-1,5-lactonase
MNGASGRSDGGAAADGAKPPGKSIDSHLHLWRYDADEYTWIDESMTALRCDFLPHDARAVMTSAGIDACIAVQARQTLEETRWLLALADEHPFIAGVVGWIDLAAPDVGAQIAAFAAHPRLLGVRHIVQAEPDGFLERPRFREGVAQLARAGLTYDILVYARQLPAAVSFAAAFPDQRFVLDHVGKPDIRRGEYREWRAGLDRLAGLPHVWCKLSGLVTESDWRSWTHAMLRPYLDAALDAFGPSRLMMGSDWPVCTLAAGYGEVLDLLESAISEYSEDEQAQILGGTARRFWNLKGD